MLASGGSATGSDTEDVTVETSAGTLLAEVHGECWRERSPRRDPKPGHDEAGRALLNRVSVLERLHFGLREDVRWLTQAFREVRDRMHHVAGSTAINTARLNRISAASGDAYARTAGSSTPPEAFGGGLRKRDFSEFYKREFRVAERIMGLSKYL